MAEKKMKTLNIEKSFENGKAVLTLEGRLNIDTAPVFSEALPLDEDSLKELVIDFEKVDYISSAGIRALLAAVQTMEGRGEMKLVKVDESIMKIFEMTGFTEIVEVEKL